MADNPNFLIVIADAARVEADILQRKLLKDIHTEMVAAYDAVVECPSLVNMQTLNGAFARGAARLALCKGGGDGTNGGSGKAAVFAQNFEFARAAA